MNGRVAIPRLHPVDTLVREAGFDDAAELARERTVYGTLAYYAGTRAR
ncbi:MAG: hypothetical protein ACOZNI_12485 [Myxococcota bacterium]